MTTIPAERLAEVFVEVADTLVDEFDLVEFLHMLARHATSLVDVPAAGLLLLDHDGLLQVMAASNETANLLELFQLQAHEGPCLDAVRTGSTVLVDELDSKPSTWPLFAPRALDSGFRSVYAFPLRLRNEVLGALNLFGTEPNKVSPADIAIVQAVADVATIGLLQERTIRRGEVITEQLQGALNSRIVIEQAKGGLSQYLGIGVDEAFEVLRKYARRHNLHLSNVALAVLRDPASLDEPTPE